MSDENTKEPEQRRRKVMTIPCADLKIQPKTPIPQNKPSFLSNKRNKQNLINLLYTYLQSSDISVVHAGDEGDADVIVVAKALEFAEQDKVCVYCEDTDVLLILIYHSKIQSRIL